MMSLRVIHSQAKELILDFNMKFLSFPISKIRPLKTVASWSRMEFHIEKQLLVHSQLRYLNIEGLNLINRN